MGFETWRMASGRVGTINLNQPADAIEALRELLRSQGAVKEEAPAELQLDEGEVTNHKEGNHSMNTVHPTMTVHPDIQEIIDRQPERLMLTGGDLYAEPEPVIWKTPEQLGADLEVGDSMHSMGRFYRFDGTQVFGATVTGVPDEVKRTLNAVHVMDDGVFVSDGYYVAEELVQIDGEPMIRLVSLGDLARREIEAARAQEQAFIDAHPAITAAKPAWAERIEVFNINAEDGVEINYCLSNSAGSVGILGVYENGEVTFTGGPEFHFEHEGAGVDQAREAIELMRRLVDAIERAEACA